MSETRAGRSLIASFLGEVPYREALEIQERCRAAVLEGEEAETLFLLQHPHVFTLGRNADHRDVVATSGWMARRGVEIVECDRGGRVTYHGPGQLVGYPVINLSPGRRDVRRYVRDLQEVLVRTLSDWGLEAVAGVRRELIGVWVAEQKIASIGVHLKRWVTTHGFSLNVSTDLEMFDGIVPCGLLDLSVTSLERELGQAIELKQVAERCAHHFSQVFERSLVWSNSGLPKAVAR